MNIPYNQADLCHRRWQEGILSKESLLPFGSLFSATIGGKFSFTALAGVIGAHSMPVVCRTANAIRSVVANFAAITRSPSFSRSSLSTTMTNRPAQISSTASATVARLTGHVDFSSIVFICAGFCAHPISSDGGICPVALSMSTCLNPNC